MLLPNSEGNVRLLRLVSGEFDTVLLCTYFLFKEFSSERNSLFFVDFSSEALWILENVRR